LDRGVSDPHSDIVVDLRREGLYLRTRYEDARRRELRIREYGDDGAVWVVASGERTLWSTFDADTIVAARQAVLDAGLGDLADIPASGHDLATMTYEWAVDEDGGRFVDASYPAVVPEAIDRLEETLMRLEEASGEP
jgi:hypothetical protein